MSDSDAQHEAQRPPAQRCVFGVPLSASLARADVVADACAVLSTKSPALASLFACSAPQSSIMAVVERYETGFKAPLAGRDGRVVAGVLRYFLTTLPDTIFTYERYDSFIAAIQYESSITKQLGLLRKTIASLPVANKHCLSHLLPLLARGMMAQATNTSSTSMTNCDDRLREQSQRLPRIVALFTSLLLRCRLNSPLGDSTCPPSALQLDAMSSDLQDATKVISTCLQHCDIVLGKAALPSRFGASDARRRRADDEDDSTSNNNDGTCRHYNGEEHREGEDAVGRLLAETTLRGCRNKTLASGDKPVSMSSCAEVPVGEAKVAENGTTIISKEEMLENIAKISVSLRGIPLDQLREHKRRLKKELRACDVRAAHANGRRPTREEKEHLRPIYHLYHAIKLELASR